MNAILERLIDMDKKNRLHHGFLFVGGSEQTQAMIQETILTFATHIFSKEFPEQAVAIRKKIENQNHPDFFQLVSAESEIKIEAVRELQKWLFLGPLEATKKIAIIPNAQHLNASCSNALLKTLEEPPPYALLILQTNALPRILPTIRSRLFHVQFPDINKQEDNEPKEWVNDLQSMLAKKTYTDKEIFAFTEALSDKRDDLIFLFEIVQQTIRDKMLQANSSEFTRLEKQYDLALNLEQQIYQNYGNISLGLDHFLISWRTT
jgi:DNA polymerase III delta prime subunit